MLRVNRIGDLKSQIEIFHIECIAHMPLKLLACAVLKVELHINMLMFDDGRHLLGWCLEPFAYDRLPIRELCPTEAACDLFDTTKS